MTKITGNEPAFPMLEKSFYKGVECWVNIYGLTGRQQFAAMAMQGILAGCNITEPLTRATIDTIAEEAVLCADTLITALNKEKEEINE